MKKNRILIVHNYYQIPGGEDTVVSNEKQLLEENGHEVFMYTRNNSDINKKNIISKVIIPFQSIFSFKTYTEIKKIIKEKKIDLVHVHNTLSLISPSVYYAALKCNIPVVQTIHNFRLLCPAATLYRDNHICEECITSGLKCAVKHKCYRKSVLQTLVSVLILKTHRALGIYRKINYICLTDFNKNKLLQLNKNSKKIIDEDKVFVKPNFIKNEIKYIPYENRKSQFVFVGRLDKLKGIRLLFEAWKDIKDFELIVCGIGPEKEWCEKYILDNNLRNIKLLGFLENKKAREIISQSKALILPTQWYEGFPMTIVESWGCGTPVIGSDIGNVGNLIEDAKTGLRFQYNSSESLKNAIYNIFDMTKISKHKYEDCYGSEVNYNILVNIYDDILKYNHINKEIDD